MKQGAGRWRLPSVTNLDVDQFPLEEVLPRLLRAGNSETERKRAVTGRRAHRGWDQTTNYLSALTALGILERKGLTAVGHRLAALGGQPMRLKRELARHVLLETSLGIVVRVLQYVAPHYSGDNLIRETMQTLEVAFDVVVPSRKQLFNYIFRFLRYTGLTNPENVPNRRFIGEVVGLTFDPYLKTLASVSREEAVVIQELLGLWDEGPIEVYRLKTIIRERWDEVLEVGLGGGGLGRRLRDKGLVTVSGGAGRGSRDTRLRLKNDVVRQFLASPVAQAYLIRANFESGGLLAHLQDLVGCPLPTLIRRMRRNPAAGRALEVVAAKLALKLGCSDITIRSRMTLPGMAAEGEKDVLATIPRPLPYRLLIQCKAHRSPLGTATLYRELAIALLSSQVRTILFFSTRGYQASTKIMQRACLRAFPYLTIVLFDSEDFVSLERGEGDVRELVLERLQDAAEEQRIVEEALTPRQMRLVHAVLGQAKVPLAQIRGVMDALWKADWKVTPV